MAAEADGSAEELATLVIGQRVRAGSREEYAVWNQRIAAAAAQYPGYVETIFREPNAAADEWVTVVKFDSVAHLRHWLNSSTRQEFLDEGQHLLDGPATQQLIVGREHHDDTLATVVVNFQVAPERSGAFLEFQHKMAESNKRYPGFRGAEVFRPIEGCRITGRCFSGSTTSNTSTHGWFPRTGGRCCVTASSANSR